MRARLLALGLLAAALYASFASFGYRLFLSGERMQFSAGRVGMLLAGIVFALANTIPDTPVRNILEDNIREPEGTIPDLLGDF